MLSYLRTRLFCQLGLISLLLQPLIAAFSFEGSVAAHGLLSTVVANIASFVVMAFLLWAIVARRSALAASGWVVITFVAVSETIFDTLNGWLFEPHHVLGAISLLLDAVCSLLIVTAVVIWLSNGPVATSSKKQYQK